MGIGISTIVTAFDEQTIGTKIIDIPRFVVELQRSIAEHDFSKDRIPGQGYLHIPGAIPFISGGMGRNRNDPKDYVLRSHRGKVHAYLKRTFAEPVVDCHVVVYTREAMARRMKMKMKMKMKRSHYDFIVV